MRTPQAIALLAALVAVVDQISKHAVLRWLKPLGSVEMPGGFWALTYSENTGGAFSFLRGYNWVFIVAGLGILAVLLVLSAQARRHPPIQNWALALLIGGAIGNLYDRIRWSFVVDFLDFKVWPIFNIADSAICVGIGLLLIAAVQEELAARRAEAAGAGEASSESASVDTPKTPAAPTG